MKKVRIGEVISNKMDKSVILKIDTFKMQPIYKKRVKRMTKLYAHDPDNKCQIGDRVKVIETRPFSKMKRWRVMEILGE